MVGNINKAIQRGGHVIMTSPLLSHHCQGATISMSVRWHNNQLQFIVKKPAGLQHPASQLVFDGLDNLIEAIRTGIADNHAEVFNFAPTFQEN